MRWMIGLFVVVALAGCGGQAAPPSQAQAVATIGAGINQPTIVPTAIPLADLDLEPLLIQSGDLPAGINGAQVSDTAPGMFRQTPKATKVIYQQLAAGSDVVGGVGILLYDKQADRDAAYQTILKGMGTLQATSEVGEDANTTSLTAAGTTLIDLAFKRCAAMVHVRMSSADLEESAVIAYAKRLDKRLLSIVCR